jgi:hypothetical protein
MLCVCVSCPLRSPSLGRQWLGFAEDFGLVPVDEEVNHVSCSLPAC